MSSAVASSGPSIVEWVVAVVGLLVQQGAFISLPFVVSGESLRATVNPFNTAAIAISMALVALVALPQIRKIASLAAHNLTSLLFLALVLGSATWSIHPDLTIRRGIGYLLTITLAGYLVVRFGPRDRMRALSASLAVSAFGSLLFVALLPQFGIMQTSDVAGMWRGVFPHKNVLGPTMALAIFVELYLIVTETSSHWRRFALVAIYAALVALSQSATALLLSILYGGSAGLYVLWKRHRTIAVVALIDGALILVAGVVALWSDPSPAFAAIGKDLTLTGRTTLWGVVVEFIKERPLLGWGYHAMWVVGDPTTIYAEMVTGNWGVASSHNAFLEITLQLGLAGTAVILMILGVALWRGGRCCRAGINPLGWFTLVFIIGAILAAQTIEALGRSQAIEWVVFNVLMFGCGLELAAEKENRLANPVDKRVVGSARVARGTRRQGRGSSMAPLGESGSSPGVRG